MYDSHTKKFRNWVGSIGILALNCIVGGLIGGVGCNSENVIVADGDNKR